ncbi:hypothetical protein H6P81_020936 [Aristolochia fimbriata]|uniref:Zinc-finger domain-containing protein n=1 Tax=Aristolochia fimbriata TaxID=158543 RepID=A0AAV7DYW7_ARIFI|nr:hypothetical protein H6P81_020936 [Aristolochia fimbriata]
MVALSKRARRTIESPATPRVCEGSSPSHNVGCQTTGYEQLRDERIKDNLERMHKLGILDLSRQLKSEGQCRKRVHRNQNENRSPRVLSPAGPARRSSRLQNLTPVSYVEVGVRGRAQELTEDGKDLLREDQRPEIYTEEHDKQLGTCEATWDMFKDGYDSTGKRIYDPVKGKTCHQCRQKTLGHRTHCSKCGIVQGQFCGDCLYMRYGEHVLEAKQNPNWICPVCRGICNCSLCRIKKGWAPTGPLYKKILNLGFKSVAHYLIQTRRSEMTPVEPVSAKRSLPFGATDASSRQGKFTTKENDGCSKATFEDKKDERCEGEVPNMEDKRDGVAQIADFECHSEVRRKDERYDGEFHSKVEKCDGGDCTTYEKSAGDKKVMNIVQSTPTMKLENGGKANQELRSSNEKYDGDDRSSEETCNEEVHGKGIKKDGVDYSSFKKITGDKKSQNEVQGTVMITGETEDELKQEFPSSNEESDVEDQSEDDKNDDGNCGLCERSTGDKKVPKVDQGTSIITMVIPVESEEKPEGEAVQSSDEKSEEEVQIIEKEHEGEHCISHDKVQNQGEDTPESEEKVGGRNKKGHPKAIMGSIPTAKKRAADRLLFTADCIAGRLRKRACRR